MDHIEFMRYIDTYHPHLSYVFALSIPASLVELNKATGLREDMLDICEGSCGRFYRALDAQIV